MKGEKLVGTVIWISRMKEKRKQKKEIKMKQKFSFIIDLLAESENNVNERIQALFECVKKSKAEIIQELLTVNDSIKLLDNNMKKLQADIAESKTIAQENIEELKKCFINNNGDIKESIHSIIEKVDQINKAGLEREKQVENILLTKSEMVISAIDDIKSLVQLLAVNELVDEIDFSAIKLMK